MTSAAFSNEKKYSVLVVDDEAGWRELISSQLTTLGCEVRTAGDAAHALEMMYHQDFDLIITDIMMPGEMDGVQMIETYRQQRNAQKVVFITAYARKADDSVFTHDRSRLVEKPFEMKQFKETIRNFLKEQ